MKHFKSSLAQQMEEYISYRLSLGYTDPNLRGQLCGFDQYVCDKEAGPDDLMPSFFLELKKKFKEKSSPVKSKQKQRRRETRA